MNRIWDEKITVRCLIVGCEHRFMILTLWSTIIYEYFSIWSSCASETSVQFPMASSPTCPSDKTFDMSFIIVMVYRMQINRIRKASRWRQLWSTSGTLLTGDKCLGKSLSQYCFVYHKSHLDWPKIQPKSLCWEASAQVPYKDSVHKNLTENMLHHQFESQLERSNHNLLWES